MNEENSKVFAASRLTSGNRILPTKLQIDDVGVTIIEPGIFNDSRTTMPFSRIASIDIDCPLIGFSSISIVTSGEGNFRVNGFTKKEVEEMKTLIFKMLK
jgi:uncharacterized membrane protein YdbT with pleckstrin-like domain